MVMYFGDSLFFGSAVCLVLWLLHCPVSTDVIVKAFNNETLQSHRDQPASPSFGTQFPRNGLWGHLFYVEPDDGCAPFKRPLNGSNWIAVMSMSELCRFEEQVFRAQAAGFVAAIVHNNESDALIEMRNASHHLHIPSTFVGLSSSNLLAQFDKRLDVSIVIVENESSDTEELLLIILAAVSSFSAVVVLGIVIGIGVHNCCRNRSQLLSRWKLKRLPVHIFKKGDLYENCAICLEEYNDGDKLRLLPCAHAFHSKCIDVWLTKNRKTCPLCNETVNPSRRKKSRADSERDRDGERRPLLMPVSNDGVSEPEENSELLGNRSSVEIHEEPLPYSAIHEEPVPYSARGHRSYGTAGAIDVFATEVDDPEGDSLFSVEYVNTYGRSPLCHIKAEPDPSALLPESETDAHSGDENQKLVETESGAGLQEPEVFVAKNILVHDRDEIV